MKCFTDHSSLLMYQHNEIFEDLIHLTNLLLNFLNSLASFINDSFVKWGLIIQQQDLMSARRKKPKAKGCSVMLFSELRRILRSSKGVDESLEGGDDSIDLENARGHRLRDVDEVLP
ncbi:hypothetical protein V6N13_074507 [Hibiscus sabdariffa]|uniref:Reverse transcriptase RNase H-like domain-containing protein n=1 Tax=Hibiscus sabdariffa TaxID=183260 RepID=A0ABR2U8R5_9ROSI